MSEQLGELAQNLIFGFGVAVTPQNLLFCLIGALLGTLVGVLPGLGPVATIAMLLPVTFTLPPVAALIMLAGLYYGAQYGGSTTAILVNIPGESSSVVTCIDGHMMARKGRAGSALAIAALGSFFAGCVSTAIVALFSQPLVRVAGSFQSPDYFGLLVFGMMAAVVLAQGSVVRSVAMVVLGLFLGLIGTDIASGQTRFTFGISALADGVGFVPVAMGLFGIAEVISSLERGAARPYTIEKISRLWPTREEARQAWPAVLRGTGIGSLLGVLPGGGALISSFASYVVEKKLAKDPSRFGQGAVEGVAGPESANNAGAQTSFIPLLAMGIPPNPVMALMLGAMTIHGIVPGPKVMTERPDLFWGMIASMWLGNLMLIVINLPLDRHLGEVPADPLPLALFHHPHLLLHRRLHGQQHHDRRADHGRVRPVRLFPDQDPLRAGAADPGFHPGADAGREFPPLAHHLARQLVGVPRAADLRELPGREPTLPPCRAAAQHPARSRGGVQGGLGAPQDCTLLCRPDLQPEGANSAHGAICRGPSESRYSAKHELSN